RQVDDQAVQDLGQVFHHPVDLAAAYADAHAVDGRVGAAVDHRPAVSGDLDPVPVPPGVRIHVEVAAPVQLAGAVVPEADGHRRHRLGHHQLADLVHQRSALGIVGLDSDAQAAKMELDSEYRQGRKPAHEDRDDIGRAADAG